MGISWVLHPFTILTLVKGAVVEFDSSHPPPPTRASPFPFNLSLNRNLQYLSFYSTKLKCT